MTIVRSRLLRAVFIALGWIWVGIAIAGVFFPLVPTTGPILLAAFFFSRSSERFDTWLLENRYFGSIVRDWRDRKGFTIRAKIVAVVAIVFSFTFTTMLALRNAHLGIRTGLWALAGILVVYVVTRPTKVGTPAIEPTTI